MLLAIQSIYIDVDLSPPQARVFSAITENEETWKDLDIKVFKNTEI
jgi:hypothetical protein